MANFGELYGDYKPIDIDYNVLTNHFWGDMVIKDSFNFWKNIGFISGMDSQKAEECAIAYDNITVKFKNGELGDLTQKIYFEFGFDFETIVFPLIRGIINKTSNFDIDDFIDYLRDMDYEVVEDAIDDFNLLIDGTKFSKDYELELITLLSKILVIKFNELDY